MELKLKDSPNDRVLNMLQSIEPLLISYVQTDPEDKELAQKVLSNLRKALAGQYDKLPEPSVKKDPLPAPAPTPAPLPTWETYMRGGGVAQAQQAVDQQLSSGSTFGTTFGTTFIWPWQE